MSSDRDVRSSVGIGDKAGATGKGGVWPISQVSLKALDRLGLSDGEIAASFIVSKAEVASLRHQYFGTVKRVPSGEGTPVQPPEIAA